MKHRLVRERNLEETKQQSSARLRSKVCLQEALAGGRGGIIPPQGLHPLSGMMSELGLRVWAMIL